MVPLLTAARNFGRGEKCKPLAQLYLLRRMTLVLLGCCFYYFEGPKSGGSGEGLVRFSLSWFPYKGKPALRSTVLYFAPMAGGTSWLESSYWVLGSSRLA